MEGKISGSFPGGGPRNKVAAAERTAAPRLSRAQEIEERAVDRHVRRRHGRRQKRIIYAAVFSVLVSGATGAYLGFRNRSTLEEVRAELAAQQAAETGGGMGDMSSEINKAMLELWRMEDVEFMWNSR